MGRSRHAANQDSFWRPECAPVGALAELAEEYSDSIAHVTTRQDFQLHYIHIEDTPVIMRRLAAVGITTREACGNTVRNVTACPIAGVCRTQSFDVTPYAKATAYFMLGHPGTQDYGRKFKIAFSGCRDEACGWSLARYRSDRCRSRTANAGLSSMWEEASAPYLSRRSCCRVRA